jgi:hypothetical protein
MGNPAITGTVVRPTNMSRALPGKTASVSSSQPAWLLSRSIIHIFTARSIPAVIVREAPGISISTAPGLIQTLDGCGSSSVCEMSLQEDQGLMSSGEAYVGRSYTAMLRCWSTFIMTG